MISAGLQNWQTANGFRQENDCVYGVYNGMGFSAANEDGGKLFTFMLSGADAAFDKIEDMLAASPQLREVQVGDVENYLALFIEEKGNETSAQVMTALLDFVLNNARSCGFSVPRVCVKCGAPANKRTFYNNMVQPMCAECNETQRAVSRAAARRQAAAPASQQDSLLPKKSGYNPEDDDTYDEYAAKAVAAAVTAPRTQPSRPQRPMPQQNEDFSGSPVPMSFGPDVVDEGSGAKGFFGALLGAIGGLVPLYALVLAADFKMLILSTLSGVCALLGYIAFGGIKKKNTAISTVLILSELFAILSFAFINIIGGMGEGLDFSAALSESLFAGYVDYINIALAVVGPLFGVAITIDKLADYLKK